MRQAADGYLELVKSSSTAKAWLVWYVAAIAEAEQKRTIDGRPLLRFADALPAHIELRKYLRICMSEQQHQPQAVYKFPLTAEQHGGLLQVTEKFSGERRNAWGNLLATGWRGPKSAEPTQPASFWKAERVRVTKLLADEAEAERLRLLNPPKPPAKQRELI